jgi:hypothetical protein
MGNEVEFKVSYKQGKEIPSVNLIIDDCTESTLFRSMSYICYSVELNEISTIAEE